MTMFASVTDDLRGHKAPLLALIIPVAFLIVPHFLEGGWLEMAIGALAALFWAAVLVWITAVVISVRRKQWWALLGAPIALYPVLLSAALLYECARGNCL